jgi:N-acetylmuramoyl-L-alanine amidase
MKVTWFELYRQGDDSYIVGWDGSKAVLKHRFDRSLELIEILGGNPDARNIHVAPAGKALPEVKIDEPNKPKSLDGLKVYLEAGHGWSGQNFDPGAVGHVQEWTQNKAQLKACANYLTQKGASVEFELYDKGTPERSLFSRGKASGPNDVFISFHNNAFNGSVQGTETFFDRLADVDDKELARVVHKHLAAASPFADRGVKQQGLGVLRATKPQNFAACLTEAYFVDGPGIKGKDMLALNEELGIAIAKGIEEYAIDQELVHT